MAVLPGEEEVEAMRLVAYRALCAKFSSVAICQSDERGICAAAACASILEWLESDLGLMRGLAAGDSSWADSDWVRDAGASLVWRAPLLGSDQALHRFHTGARGAALRVLPVPHHLADGETLFLFSAALLALQLLSTAAQL